MKQLIKTRIENFKGEFFLDYSHNGKDWKNWSVEKTYEKALKEKLVMMEFYSIEPEEKEKQNIVGWKCTADGKHWAEFKEKKCRYCLPVFQCE